MVVDTPPKLELNKAYKTLTSQWGHMRSAEVTVTYIFFIFYGLGIGLFAGWLIWN